LLTEWYRSGGKRGLPMEGQELVDLGFALGMMPDQILESDDTWVNKMLAANYARVKARLPQ
jgi:hypothetical protein